MDEYQWIVRTKDLFITRPMSQADLIKKIEKGDLNPLDEICAGNGYWFALHEVAEVRKHLGDIDLGRLSSGVEIEITSATETTAIKKTLILDVPKSWNTSPPDQKTLFAPQYTLTPVDPNGGASQPRRAKAFGSVQETERHWTPAVIFGILFTVVLIFLWMNSD